MEVREAKPENPVYPSDEMINEAIFQGGQKAIRLDVKEDYPVTSLYIRFGFEYIETVEAFYPDIGCPLKFMMYEKAIDLNQ